MKIFFLCSDISGEDPAPDEGAEDQQRVGRGQVGLPHPVTHKNRRGL